MILEIIETNFLNSKDWSYKLKNDVGETFFIMEKQFYTENGIKDFITKQHLDTYDVGMKIMADVKDIQDKKVVVKITQFLIR